MIFLKDTDRVALNKTFVSSTDYSERTKSHIPLLFDKNFNQNTISIIYEIPIEDIYILLKFIEYFGLKEYFNLNFETLSQRVKNENYRLELEKIKNKKRSFFYYVVWPFRSIYYFFKNLTGVGYAFLSYFVLWFSHRDTPNTVNKNSIKIQKGASGNKLMQITNLIIVNGATLEKQKESIVTHSEVDIIEKVEKLIASDDNYSFGNDFADQLFQKAKNVNEDKSISEESKRRKIKWYATLIVFLLLYSTTFKGGMSTITILGIVIAVSFKGCFSNTSENFLNTLTSDKPISKTITDSLTLKPRSDSTILDKKNEEQTINNYAMYEKEVVKYFEHDANCFSLCGIGQKQRVFIEKLDKVDHLEQDYCVSQPDGFYYVHVVAYNNINEAVFQMHYINGNTEFKAKVLETFTNNGLLYAVIIGKFTGEDVSTMCEIVSEWKSKCLSNEAEIGCLYNGI